MSILDCLTLRARARVNVRFCYFFSTLFFPRTPAAVRLQLFPLNLVFVTARIFRVHFCGGLCFSTGHIQIWVSRHPIAIEFLTRHEDRQSGQPPSQKQQPLKWRTTRVGQFSLYWPHRPVFESEIVRFNGGNKRRNLSYTLYTRRCFLSEIFYLLFFPWMIHASAALCFAPFSGRAIRGLCVFPLANWL